MMNLNPREALTGNRPPAFDIANFEHLGLDEQIDAMRTHAAVVATNVADEAKAAALYPYDPERSAGDPVWSSVVWRAMSSSPRELNSVRALVTVARAGVIPESGDSTEQRAWTEAREQASSIIINAPGPDREVAALTALLEDETDESRIGLVSKMLRHMSSKTAQQTAAGAIAFTATRLGFGVPQEASDDLDPSDQQDLFVVRAREILGQPDPDYGLTDELRDAARGEAHQIIIDILLAKAEGDTSERWPIIGDAMMERRYRWQPRLRLQMVEEFIAADRPEWARLLAFSLPYQVVTGGTEYSTPAFKALIRAEAPDNAAMTLSTVQGIHRTLYEATTNEARTNPSLDPAIAEHAKTVLDELKVEGLVIEVKRGASRASDVAASLANLCSDYSEDPPERHMALRQYAARHLLPELVHAGHASEALAFAASLEADRQSEAFTIIGRALQGIKVAAGAGGIATQGATPKATD